MKKELILCTTLLLLIITLLTIGCGDGASNSQGGITEQHIWQKPPGSTVVTPATFGNPSASGCSGRGVCSGGPISGVTLSDTFNVNATKDTITVWFNLAQDTANGSSQRQFFYNNADTTYSFDMPCDVSNQNPLFANAPEWPLGSGYIVPPGVTFNTQYDAPTGVEIFRIPIVKVTPQVMHVIFGGTTPNGQYSATAPGIYKVSKDPIQAGGGAPASIPVTFALAPVLPGSERLLTPNLIMYFDSAKLGAIQPKQRSNFNCGAGSIMFSKNYPLSNPMFSFLSLPLNAQILAGPSNNILSCGNGWDTVRCTYGFTCVPDTLALTVTEGNCLVTTTSTSITVNLTNSHKPLMYCLRDTAGMYFQNYAYYPGTTISATGLNPGQTYCFNLTDYQRDMTTQCISRNITVTLPASGGNTPQR